jgi:hypothetical protein
MKISQREAQRLKKRVEELERNERENRSAWAREYIGGVHVDTVPIYEKSTAIARTVRKLGHALVAIPDASGKDQLLLYAVKP